VNVLLIFLARLPEMDVNIHKAWHEYLAFRIDERGFWGWNILRNFSYFPIMDQDIAYLKLLRSLLD
jgi:hypothetical protein